MHNASSWAFSPIYALLSITRLLSNMTSYFVGLEPSACEKYKLRYPRVMGLSSFPFQPQLHSQISTSWGGWIGSVSRMLINNLNSIDTITSGEPLIPSHSPCSSSLLKPQARNFSWLPPGPTKVTGEESSISHPASPESAFSQSQHPPTVFGKPRVRKPPNPRRVPRRRPVRAATAVTEARCNKLMAAMATTAIGKPRASNGSRESQSTNESEGGSEPC